MQQFIAAGMVALVILAGCLQEGNAPFAPQADAQTGENPRFPGLVLNASVSGSGSAIQLNGTATNMGPHTYKISSICAPPWSDQMRDDAGSVQRTEPMAYCAAFGLKEFRPGATESFSVTWNGTLWDEDRRTYRAAPPGLYMWTVSFEAFRGGDTTIEFDERGTTSVSLEVTVS